jgi:hypothetical protein
MHVGFGRQMRCVERFYESSASRRATTWSDLKHLPEILDTVDSHRQTNRLSMSSEAKKQLLKRLEKWYSCMIIQCVSVSQ